MLLASLSATPSCDNKHLLLCGTQYGRVYLDALYKTRHLNLAAILSRGSRASILLAEQAGVSSIKQLNELSALPDAAIVAVGQEAGFNLAKSCLQRRIPVLLEHPVLPYHCTELLAIAKALNVPLHINSHFSLLPPAQEFVLLCRALSTYAQPLSMQISCNTRTLFSMLDILQMAFGTFDLNALQIDALDDEHHYYQISFKLNGASCVIQYQNWRCAQDNSLDSPLGHQCTITFPQGVVQLNGSFGPCLWFPLMAATQGVNYPAYSSLSHLRAAPSQTDIVTWREDANIQAIDSLLTPDRNNPSQTSLYLNHLCQNWHRLFMATGIKVVPTYAEQLQEIFFTAEKLVSGTGI